MSVSPGAATGGDTYFFLGKLTICFFLFLVIALCRKVVTLFSCRLLATTVLQCSL